MIKFYVRAIGKLKNKPLLTLIEDYRSKMSCLCEIHEFEAKKTSVLPTNLTKSEEAKLLLNNTKPSTYKIALDESGELLSSHRFAELVAKKSTIGYSSFTFFIGGADGLDDSVRKSSDSIVSFGRITLPHMLARLVLIEQLYRCEKILDNHPYDK